ncbi:MAG TPA: sodium:proton antiporter [Candidatus Limnocylindrales bacterium]
MGSQIVVTGFVVLLGIAIAVALVTQRRSIPYSVALVVAGLLLALLEPTPDARITPDLILAVFIPGLVFEAAYHIDLDQLRRSFTSVAVLAVPGVVITAGLVAVIVSQTTGLAIDLAFVLGAIVCATDPVATVAVFRQLHAPRALGTVVEAESLLNDGTGVMLFTIALAAVSTPVSPIDGFVEFVVELLVSAVIGALVGILAVRVMHMAEDQTVRVMISIVAAYGTYLLADTIHESGIIATVVAGLAIGNAGGRFALPSETTEALDTVWDVLAFLLTALVFLLVGAVITPSQLAGAGAVIVAGFAGITVARAVAVYGLLGAGGRLLARGHREPIPLGYLHVMFWAGLRGAIAIALVLSLPADLPQHDLIAGGVYGIVLVTLLVQGTTAGWVVRHAGVLEPERMAPGSAAE